MGDDLRIGLQGGGGTTSRGYVDGEVTGDYRLPVRFLGNHLTLDVGIGVGTQFHQTAGRITPGGTQILSSDDLAQLKLASSGYNFAGTNDGDITGNTGGVVNGGATRFGNNLLGTVRATVLFHFGPLAVGARAGFGGGALWRSEEKKTGQVKFPTPQETHQTICNGPGGDDVSEGGCETVPVTPSTASVAFDNKGSSAIVGAAVLNLQVVAQFEFEGWSLTADVTGQRNFEGGHNYASWGLAGHLGVNFVFDFGGATGFHQATNTSYPAQTDLFGAPGPGSGFFPVAAPGPRGSTP
jgi:hypothetical protein